MGKHREEDTCTNICHDSKISHFDRWPRAHTHTHTYTSARTLVNSATFVNSVAVITRQTLRLLRTAPPPPPSLLYIYQTGNAKRRKRKKKIIRDRGFSARKPDARRSFVLVVRSDVSSPILILFSLDPLMVNGKQSGQRPEQGLSPS